MQGNGVPHSDVVTLERTADALEGRTLGDGDGGSKDISPTEDAEDNG